MIRPTFLFITILILSACNSGSSGNNSSSSSLPLLDITEWQNHMLYFGEQLANRLDSSALSSEEKLAETYYDAQHVFFQIADLTGDSSWNDRAQKAEQYYRDYYLLPNQGFLPGYWLFPHGLMDDYIRTGDDNSKEALRLIAENGAYARDSTNLEETIHVDFSRETAYVIQTYIAAEMIGLGKRERLNLLLQHCLGHFDQWFVSKSAPYIRPFMVALSAQALIYYYENIEHDSRIIEILSLAVDELWKMWLPEHEAFSYTDRNTEDGGTEPAPDLNLLIAPVYSWVYKQTGNQELITRGDQIFSGGVKHAFLDSGKHFNQNYRWSFSYLKWRE